MPMAQMSRAGSEAAVDRMASGGVYVRVPSFVASCVAAVQTPLMPKSMTLI